MAKRLWTGLLIILALSGVAFLNSQAAVSSNEGKSASVSTSESIEQLTQQDRVVSYLREHQRLPDFYITKKQARAEGWDASAGNLCSAVPVERLVAIVFLIAKSVYRKKPNACGEKPISIIIADVVRQID